MQALHSEIQIETPPQRVWQVLTDFDAYPQWNPFIRSIQGDVQVGSRLSIRVEPPGARGDYPQADGAGPQARARVALARPPAHRGLADGEHRLALEPLDGGRSRFVQSERFSGLLVGLLRSTLARPRGASSR